MYIIKSVYGLHTIYNYVHLFRDEMGFVIYGLSNYKDADKFSSQEEANKTINTMGFKSTLIIIHESNAEPDDHP
jgi:hypothetical protein